MSDRISLFKNKTGFSLVEVLISLALLSAIGLGVASLSGMMNKETKGAESMSSRTEFASAMSIHLYSPSGCAAIKTRTYSTSDQDFELSNWTYEGVGTFKSQTKMKMFMLDKFTSRLEDSSALPSIKMTLADGSERDLKKTLLVVTAKIKVKDKVYKHVYNVPVLTDGVHVEFCGDDRTMAETCAALNGKLDPVTKDCQMRQTCTAHGSFVTLTCNPVLVGGCDTSRGTNQGNPAAGGIQGCPYGSTVVTTGADTFTVSKSCGKKCTADINHTLGYYSCIKCSSL